MSVKWAFSSVVYSSLSRCRGEYDGKNRRRKNFYIKCTMDEKVCLNFTLIPKILYGFLLDVFGNGLRLVVRS